MSSSSNLDVQVLDKPSFEMVDENKDGRYEALEVTLQIRLTVPVYFRVRSLLMQQDAVISNASFFRDTRPRMLAIEGTAGVNSVTVSFSGEQIRRSGKNGPYQLKIDVIGQDFAEQKIFDTPNYKSDLFGEI